MHSRSTFEDQIDKYFDTVTSDYFKALCIISAVPLLSNQLYFIFSVMITELKENIQPSRM